VETCFTDGVPVKHGETIVEVTIERSRNEPRTGFAGAR
jgi:hypothetical protein